MKYQAIDHIILAMKANMVQLKGKLALSKNIEQMSTKKTGEGTNKQRQKKDAAWKKVPTQEGKPTTKRINTKDFHWCEHHMAWTVHLPTDFRLNGAALATGSATPMNTNPQPTGVTAVAATFTA